MPTPIEANSWKSQGAVSTKDSYAETSSWNYYSAQNIWEFFVETYSWKSRSEKKTLGFPCLNAHIGVVQ
jgi:hypothetical protein